MKRSYLIAGGLAACVAVAVLAYFWATGVMDSLYAYSSPLRDHTPEPGQALGEPVSGRVVFVLIDGLRVDTSLKAEVMPFLDELRQRGAWGTMHSRPPSYSTPGYSVLFTGAWPQINDGPVMNLEYEEMPTWTQDN
ncbi:MAG: alkaline phosphatase family protein, partial [Anaerolineales bacterium]